MSSSSASSSSSFCIQPFDWQLDKTQKETIHIHAWCLDRDSKPCLVRIEDFKFFVYVELPSVVDDTPVRWNEQKAAAVYDSICGRISYFNKVNTGNEPNTPLPGRYVFDYYSKLYYFKVDKHGSEVKYPMLVLLVDSILLLEKLRSILKLPMKVNNVGKNVVLTMHEDQISTVLKMLSIRKIGFSQWFSSERAELVDECERISSLEREYIVPWQSMTPIAPEVSCSWLARPSILSIDIETYSDNHRMMPNEAFDKHVMYMCSCIYQTFGLPDTRQRYLILLGDCDDVEGSTIIRVKTEREFVEKLAELVNRLDPDILAGFNTLGYDYRYMNTRVEKTLTMVEGRNVTTSWPEMGRLKGRYPRVETKTWESSAYGKNVITNLMVDGRISIDMLPIVKRDYKMDKYDLNSVSKKFLDATKHDVTAQTMFAIYEWCNWSNESLKNLEEGKPIVNPPEEDAEAARRISRPESLYDIDLMDMIKLLVEERNIELMREKLESEKRDSITAMTAVVRYCIQDSELVVRLIDKLNAWIGLIELSNIVWVPIVDIFTRGQQIRCLSQIYVDASSQGIVVDRHNAPDIPFEGGAVADPIPGVHDNVICLDFASLYPSIIQAYNICFRTLLLEKDWETVSQENCNVFNIREEIVEKSKKEEDEEEDDEVEGPVTLKESQYKFVRPEVRRGILPTLVRRLVEERRRVRKRLDGVKREDGTWEIEPEQDAVTSAVLEERQRALKVSANSMFGFLGVPNGKLPLIEGAKCITAKGRELITIVGRHLHEKYGARVVYGDTDSSMVSIPQITDPSQCDEWGRILSEEINGTKDRPGLFPPPLKMEYEKAMRLLCLKKKKYVAFYIKDGKLLTKKEKILMKGVVVARRDNCKWLRDLYMEVAHRVLMRNPWRETLQYILDSVYELLENTSSFDWRRLVVIRSLGANYKSPNYFMNMFRNYLLMNRRYVAQPGERLDYVIVKTPTEQPLGMRMRLVKHYEEDIANGVAEPIDASYYIEKSIMNPIDQIFSIGYIHELSSMQGMIYKPTRANEISISSPIKIMMRAIHDGFTNSEIRPMFNCILSGASVPRPVSMTSRSSGEPSSQPIKRVRRIVNKNAQQLITGFIPSPKK